MNKTIHQIADEFTWGSDGFIREVETHVCTDCSREEIERIASLSSTPDEFMTAWENDDSWRNR